MGAAGKQPEWGREKHLIPVEKGEGRSVNKISAETGRSGPDAIILCWESQVTFLACCNNKILLSEVLQYHKNVLLVNVLES
jgi:hypothetical protein